VRGKMGGGVGGLGRDGVSGQGGEFGGGGASGRFDPPVLRRSYGRT